jgi:hypothetical protein
MVEWSGREMECPYENEALKFVHKISPVILDAFICFENDRKPAKLKDNRSKSAQPYVRRKICKF